MRLVNAMRKVCQFECPESFGDDLIEKDNVNAFRMYRELVISTLNDLSRFSILFSITAVLENHSK